jgi:hypothetical protein
MRTTYLPGRTCPYCHGGNDGASAADGAPSPDDYSVCWHCGSVAIYDAALQLVPLPPGAPLPDDVLAYVVAWERAHRMKWQ